VGLSPASSRGGGGGATDLAAVLAEGDDAGGGTITNLSTLAMTANPDGGAPIAVTGNEDNSDDLFHLTPADPDEIGVFKVDYVGRTTLSPNGNGGTALTIFTADNGVSNGFVVHDGATGEIGLIIDAQGRPALSVHSAPADGGIDTGAVSLWFDQTNGAAKLMVKGKQEDGTVVTGSVSLA
jgi:hypothetical protein